MQSPLPSITFQQRLGFRVSPEDVKYAYKILNRYIFDNQLIRPNIEVGITRGYWGICHGHMQEQSNGGYSSLKISDKYYCAQWFLNVLAHEMAHQYQWDVIAPERMEQGMRPLLSHGPTFFIWRERMEHYGLHLKTAHSRRRWFAHQDLRRC
jgi:hypothetical protein